MARLSVFSTPAHRQRHRNLASPSPKRRGRCPPQTVFPTPVGLSLTLTPTGEREGLRSRVLQGLLVAGSAVWGLSFQPAGLAARSGKAAAATPPAGFTTQTVVSG